MYLGYLSRLFISAQVFVPPVVGIALGAVAAIYAKQLLLPPQAIRDIPEIYARALAAATGGYLGYISGKYLGHISDVSRPYLGHISGVSRAYLGYGLDVDINSIISLTRSLRPQTAPLGWLYIAAEKLGAVRRDIEPR